MFVKKSGKFDLNPANSSAESLLRLRYNKNPPIISTDFDALLSDLEFLDFALVYDHIGAGAFGVAQSHIVDKKRIDNRAGFDLDVACGGGMLLYAVNVT